MCSEDKEAGKNIRRKVLIFPLMTRVVTKQTDACLEALADWPRLYSGTYTLLGTMFRNERIRYEVAVLVTSAVMNSLRFHHLRDPTFDEFGLGRETFTGLAEAKALEVFRMDKWSESYYRRWLESPVREELLAAGYLVPRPGQTAGEVIQQPESIPMSDDEWKAIRVLCHYLWFLLRAQTPK